MKNPEVKIVDIVYMTESKNSHKTWQNTPLKVTSIQSNKNFNVVQLDGKLSGGITIYRTVPYDTYVFATRKQKVGYLKTELDKLMMKKSDYL